MGGGVAGDAGVVDAQARADAFQLCFHAVGVDDNITANRGGTVTEHKDAPGLGTAFGGGAKTGISPVARSAVATRIRTPPCMVVIHSSPGFRSYNTDRILGHQGRSWRRL